MNARTEKKLQDARRLRLMRIAAGKDDNKAMRAIDLLNKMDGVYLTRAQIGINTPPAPVPMAAGASSESCGTAAKHAIPSRTKSGAGRSGSAMTSASAPPEPPIVPVAGIGKATPWQVS